MSWAVNSSLSPLAVSRGQQDSAPSDIGQRREYAQNGFGRDAFAAAALSHQTQGPVFRDDDIYPADRVDHAFAKGKLHVKIFDFNEGCVFHGQFL